MSPAEIPSISAVVLAVVLAVIAQTGGIIIAIVKTGGKTNKTLTEIKVALATKVEEKDCEHRREKLDNEVDTRFVRHSERQAQVNTNIYDNLSRLAARTNGGATNPTHSPGNSKLVVQ